MQNGRCPKCNSTEVYRGTQSLLQAGEGLLHLVAYVKNTGVNLMLDAYVCSNCGYVEMYVADSSKGRLGLWRKTTRPGRKLLEHLSSS